MATSVNISTGRLTKDPVITAKDDKKFARFTIACKRNYKNKQTNEYESDFYPVVVLNSSLVEHIVEPYLKQGSMVTVTGRWTSGSYTNKDGQKVYTMDLQASDIDLSPMGSKNSNSSNSNGAADANAPVNEGFMDLPEGDDPYSELLP